MSRLTQPQLSFADLELRNQGVHVDPLLQGVLNFLDDHAMLGWVSGFARSTATCSPGERRSSAR